MLYLFVGIEVEVGGLPSRYCFEPRSSEFSNVPAGCRGDLNQGELELLYNQGFYNISFTGGEMCYCDRDLCNDDSGGTYRKNRGDSLCGHHGVMMVIILQMWIVTKILVVSYTNII